MGAACTHDVSNWNGEQQSRQVSKRFEVEMTHHSVGPGPRPEVHPQRTHPYTRPVQPKKELPSSSHKGVLSMEVRGAHYPLTGWD